MICYTAKKELQFTAMIMIEMVTVEISHWQQGEIELMKTLENE